MIFHKKGNLLFSLFHMSTDNFLKKTVISNISGSCTGKYHLPNPTSSTVSSN